MVLARSTWRLQATMLESASDFVSGCRPVETFTDATMLPSGHWQQEVRWRIAA
jgi:hypothetical protein